MSHLPPYNGHLLRDSGGASLALAVVLCAAVATMERRLVLTALTAYLVSSLARLLFHASHLEPLSAASAAGFMVLLGPASCSRRPWCGWRRTARRCELDPAGRQPAP
ncbi:hypothetical protein AB0P07_08470 [Streptomyces sp. NPDC085944]|uniref:hypothetical protein n=1 Tax=Streptomyces sp. NPDC085944 TaxID=3154962 RepID=UPI003447C8B8